MGVKKTHQQFLDEILEKGIQVKVLENYVNSQTPISCKCKKCGLVWKIRPNNLLRGYGCPKCGIEKRAQSQSKDNTDFIVEMSKINPKIKIQEEYKGARRPITCKCNTCGHTWKAAPTNLLKDRGCPECAKIVRADKNRRSHNEFLTIIKSFGRNIVPLEEFKGNSHPIKMLCNVCGYQWTTQAGSIIYGSGCPRCANNGIYSTKEFVQKLNILNPHIEILSEYQRSAKPIKCKCKICGNIWETKPNSLLSGSGCPTCYHSTTSFVEQVILEVFSLIVGKEGVVSRDKKAIGKELDIYVPSLKIAIEPGSWRWHKDKIENDKTKRILCNDMGIKLITIYTDFTASQPPFDDNCICVKETLGFENDLYTLKDLIANLLSLTDIQMDISYIQWEEIIKKAYIQSRRLTTSEFKKKVALLHPNIEITGEYTGAWNKIECLCKKCAHRWKPAANSLLQNHGCPKCADKEKGLKKRKTHEQFVDELKRINPQVKLLNNYVISTQKITCLCLACGHEWEALPWNLLKGKGCPICARKRRNNETV